MHCPELIAFLLRRLGARLKLGDLRSGRFRRRSRRLSRLAECFQFALRIAQLVAQRFDLFARPGQPIGEPVEVRTQVARLLLGVPRSIFKRVGARDRCLATCFRTLGSSPLHSN